MTIVQADRSQLSFEVSTLPRDAFQVRAFEGVEAISQPYRYTVELSSEEPELDLGATINTPAVFSVSRTDGTAVPTHGLVSSMSQHGSLGDRYLYRATMVPRLWLLSLNHRSRVIQHRSVTEIVTDTLIEAGIPASDFTFDLEMDLSPREYCVQYDETDLAFVMRLLEHEGISFLFTHEGGRESILFTNYRGGFPEIVGDPGVSFHTGAGLVPENQESVKEFLAEHKMVTGSVLLKDYNYTTPEAELVSESPCPEGNPGVAYEYGQGFGAIPEGDRIALVRREELAASRVVFEGSGSVPAFRAGHTFSLTNHEFRPDYVADYLLRSVIHRGRQAGAMGFADDASATYENEFSCIPVGVPYRPPRVTPTPRVAGVMTAKVETAGGEYAHIDDQGRYNVKMPFDLSGAGNATASLPIRLAQPYSGSNYGIHFPNKAGTEMVWACIDGDPDRPLGLSTVPNPSNASPAVAGNRAQNVIRTAGQNELTMDDTVGGENILLHGTKDWTIEITNDKRQTVGNDESHSVGRNREKSVVGNETETVDGDRAVTIGGGHKKSVAGMRNISVGQSATEIVKDGKLVGVGAAYAIGVGTLLTENVGSTKTETIGKDKSVTVRNDSSEKVGSDKRIQAGKSVTVSAEEKVSIGAGDDLSGEAGETIWLKSGKHLLVDVGEQTILEAMGDIRLKGGKSGIIDVTDDLTLKCGKAMIVLKKSGEIILKGTKLSGKFDQQIVLKARKSAINP